MVHTDILPDQLYLTLILTIASLARARPHPRLTIDFTLALTIDFTLALGPALALALNLPL